MHSLPLGFVSDEISLDFSEALQHGLIWGTSLYEIRCLTSGRIPNVDTSEVREVLNLVATHRVAISALSPGVFKHPLSKMNDLEEELSDTLPRTIALAKKFGTKLIIVFGFQREQGEPGDHYHRAVEFIRRAARFVGQEGMRLAIENEPGFWCDTGSNTAQFIKDVGSTAVGANWDPCNAYGTHELPFPDGYQALREFILNVHVKDTKEGALVRCVPIGEGVVDWKGQLRALVRDQIVPHVTIETHCHPLIENSKQNVDTLRAYFAEIGRSEKAMR